MERYRVAIMETTTIPKDDMERDALRYRRLRDYLLVHGIVRFVPVSSEEGEPFVLGNNFYGPSFGEAVDTLWKK